MSTYSNAGSSSRVLQPWDQTGHQDDMDSADEEDNAFRDMSFEDVLEELIARFMVNLPKEERTPVRLYWQAEQAHWFYDDYLRPLNPTLPPLSQKHFTKVIISSSPLYSNLVEEDGRPINYELIWERYTRYKRMVPTCGVILINAKESKTLLVRHYGSKAWSWPRGKINELEPEVACAVREVEEETGYNCSSSIDPNAKCQAFINGQSSTMFFVTGVPEDFPFAAQTRNEIEETRWVKLQDLPTWSKKRQAGKGLVYFKVAPFVDALKHFLHNPSRQAANGNTQRSLQGAVRNDASVPSAVPVQSVPAVSSRPITEPLTTLDKLFATFVHGQEADLQQDGPGGDADNRDGIGRLFGASAASEQTKREEKEDDVLARLLGAMSSSATPAPTIQVQQPSDPGRAKLLSVLNQKPSTQQDPKPHVQETPETHASSLLAMLAQPAQSPTETVHRQQTPHGSLSNTPRQASPPADDRANRQKALLNLTLAGLNLNTNPTPPVNQGQSSYSSNEYHTTTYGASHEPSRATPPQAAVQQQYRPPAPPVAFPPPPSGAYYTTNPAQPPQSHHLGSTYAHASGASPPRNRGAPPPYETHYGGPGPVRPMPPVVPVQSHEYNSPTQGYYARPQPPVPAQGQGYRPHQHIQPQPHYGSGFQQSHVPPQNSHPHGVPYNNAPTGYQIAPHRPPPIQGPTQYQPSHTQQQHQQQPYIPSVHGQLPHQGGQNHHTGPMHQPIPKNGPQNGLLAMLNNR